MKTLIANALVIDPANGVQSRLNVLLDGDRIAAVGRERPEADNVIDATGKIVCPGFVDIHMHEDPVGEDGRIVYDEERSIFACMLRMGVTTAVGGNCGDNACDPGDYLDLVDRDGACVNVGMLAGHTYFREQSGARDKYAPATPGQIEYIRQGIERSLQRGCLGVSYGVRYVPGTTPQELALSAEPLRNTGKLLAAHIRSDAEEVFDSAMEIIQLGRGLGVQLELSHIGSMAGFGQMADILSLVDSCRANGLAVGCDCYPYAAFSTSLGTYDDGWLERYHCDYGVLEFCEGKYKGQRATASTFAEMRRDFPECKTVCYVIQPEEVSLALQHPGVILGSDGILNDGQGHPRAAGAFPRFLAEYVRTGLVPLYTAISLMTSIPAQRLGLKNKGRLSVGSDADLVIFDPQRVRDCATFTQPLLPPESIDYVFVGGRLAARDGRVVSPRCGKAVRT